MTDWWKEAQSRVLTLSLNLYENALEKGIAKEQARALLPEGLTKSRMYMNGSLRSWIHYCELRMGEETQKEHREIAQMCWDILVKQFPSLKEEV